VWVNLYRGLGRVIRFPVCTLVFLYGLLEDYPVVVLHNRYLIAGTLEQTPRIFEGGRRVYAPYDVISRGTWVGFNESGLLVAVTNQETEYNEKPARSRGLLNMDLLDGCDSADEAKDFLADPDVRWDYRRGNFLVADARSAWHIIWDRETSVKPLNHGSHVVTTLTLMPGIEWTERAEKMWVNVEKRKLRAYHLVNRLEPCDVNELIESLELISADHGDEKGQGSICYHDSTGKNVQTSATILAVGSKNENSKILYCPGNTCENYFEDYSGIIKKRA
jgi:uncharacterized protein with NRDE domain